MTEYECYNTVINALTGIGTIGAVVTSLYLAKRSIKPKVKVSISFVVFASYQHGSVSEQFIEIKATNIGTMKERIESYGYIFGALRWRKRAYIPPSPSVRWAHSFPSTIEPGESVCDFVKIIDFDKYHLPIFTEYLTALPIVCDVRKRFVLNIALRFVRCWVSLSRSEDISISIGSSLRRYIINKYQAIRNTA